MATVSVIMPVYNVEAFVADAVRSVLAQTFEDLELLIVDDCSPDRSIEICESFDDPRVRIVRHTVNRGLAGARNSGIREARGELLAFIDSDDIWHAQKLARHVDHLRARREVGVSFSRSAFIDESGVPNGVYQMPRMRGITAAYCLCRNPIGNGSAPVIRRAVFDEIRYVDTLHGDPESCYFDERFRRSEDIECWIRVALTTDWIIEGIPRPLTFYRLNAGGLSASLLKQLESWEQMVAKTRTYAPEFIDAHEAAARAFQLRYLARQAIRLRDGRMAASLMGHSLHSDWRIILREPGRTLLTAGAAALLRLLPGTAYERMERCATRAVSMTHETVIRRQIAGAAEA